MNKHRVEIVRSSLTMWGKRSCNRQTEARRQPGKLVATKEDVMDQRCGDQAPKPTRSFLLLVTEGLPSSCGILACGARHQEGQEGQPHETALSHHF